MKYSEPSLPYYLAKFTNGIEIINDDFHEFDEQVTRLILLGHVLILQQEITEYHYNIKTGEITNQIRDMLRGTIYLETFNHETSHSRKFSARPN